MQQALVLAAGEGHSKICEFLLNLKTAAGGGFDINFTDTLTSETGVYTWTYVDDAACAFSYNSKCARLLKSGYRRIVLGIECVVLRHVHRIHSNIFRYQKNVYIWDNVCCILSRNYYNYLNRCIECALRNRCVTIDGWHDIESTARIGWSLAAGILITFFSSESTCNFQQLWHRDAIKDNLNFSCLQSPCIKTFRHVIVFLIPYNDF